MQILQQYKPDHVCPSKDTEIQPTPMRPRFRKGQFSSYDDPNALCATVFVENKFTAKLLYHFLKDLSRSDDAFSFLMPQYATELDPLGKNTILTVFDSSDKFLLLYRHKLTLILKPLPMLFCSLKIVINSCRFFFHYTIVELGRIFKGQKSIGQGF